MNSTMIGIAALIQSKMPTITTLPTISIISSNVNIVKKELTFYYYYENSFDLTDP